jgi:hypothetical protein
MQPTNADHNATPHPLVARWEQLPGRMQFACSFLVLGLMLLAIHLIGFPKLTFGRSLSYAIGESVPIALVITGASQAEAARRRARDEQDHPEADTEPHHNPHSD